MNQRQTRVRLFFKTIDLCNLNCSWLSFWFVIQFSQKSPTTQWPVLVGYGETARHDFRYSGTGCPDSFWESSATLSLNKEQWLIHPKSKNFTSLSSDNPKQQPQKGFTKRYWSLSLLPPYEWGKCIVAFSLDFHTQRGAYYKPIYLCRGSRVMISMRIRRTGSSSN